MNRVSQRMMRGWVNLGPRFLPFADAATPELPLGRLLRLSLFQVSVGMALVLLIGTLNRVMIVELNVPASLVGIMISLPLIFAPFRALIGFRSDTHTSPLGWKRVPFMYHGAMAQFGGLAIMPFALLVLAHLGNAEHVPAWIGDLGAALAFLLVGAGLHTTQTVGLALATDLAPAESQPKVVGLMYVMLLFGMIISALGFGAFLANFTPGRLVQVIQSAALATVVLNFVALWKQEGRRPSTKISAPVHPRNGFRDAWERFSQGENTVRRLLAVGLGTMAFSMEDVLLEPYGGQVLHLTVGGTTKLTATLALGGLFGFGLASRVLGRGFDPFRMACYGALVGLPAFASVILAAPMNSPALFGLGTFLIGFGAGLFGHGTLTATMQNAPKSQTGLALGAWGAVQASAAGVSIALGGIIRDVVAGAVRPTGAGAAIGYDSVYSLELVLLLATLLTMIPLLRRVPGLRGSSTVLLEPGRKPRPDWPFWSDKMPITVTRLYGTPETADSAVKELKRQRFSGSDIHVVRPPAPGAEDGVVSAIVEAGISKSRAEKYAESVKKGNTLVIVYPPFGNAALAEEVVDHFSPVMSDVPARDFDDSYDFDDDATPFSRALGWKVLSHDPAPFSSALGWATLANPKSKTYPAAFGKVTLSHNPAPFSSLFGLPLLSHKAAPFSGLFGLRTLIAKAAPFSEKLGLKTLASKKHMTGDIRLSSNPAPLSHTLKLLVLTKDQ